MIGGSGNLGTPAEGASYPVIGAQKTLDLMNGATPSYGRKGIGGCASPVPLKDRDEAPCRASTVPPGRTSAAVTGAVFGLAVHSVDAKPVLVPSWLFQVRPAGAGDTFTVAHPAVDPRIWRRRNHPDSRVRGPAVRATGPRRRRPRAM